MVGHLGFDRVEVGDRQALKTQAYAPYFYHKYFEVNYADGLLPFDQWFGTWHDGSEVADERTEQRFVKKSQRLAARNKQKRQ